MEIIIGIIFEIMRISCFIISIAALITISWWYFKQNDMK